MSEIMLILPAPYHLFLLRLAQDPNDGCWYGEIEDTQSNQIRSVHSLAELAHFLNRCSDPMQSRLFVQSEYSMPQCNISKKKE